MYLRSSTVYDAIYKSKGKDYLKETETILSIISKYQTSQNKSLLDVACGTGMHLSYLKKHFDVEGIDVSPRMVRFARNANPDIQIHRMDMIKFNLGRQFGIVCCLFSSIGFVRSEIKLRKAISCMSRHLAPGGILILEPWLFPEAIHPEQLHAAFVDKPEVKVARMSIVKIDGRDWKETDHFLVMTHDGVHHFREKLKMGIFDKKQYQDAMEEIGLIVHFDETGLTGRGLFIGINGKKGP